MKGLLLILLGTGTVAAVQASSQEREWEDLKRKAYQHFEKKEYAQAIDLAEKALKTAQDSFGGESLKAAESMGNLAVLYRIQSKHLEESARKLREKHGVKGPPPGIEAEAPAGKVEESRPSPEAKPVPIDKRDAFKVYTGFLDAVFKGDKDEAHRILSGELLRSEVMKDFNFSLRRPKYSYDPRAVKNLGKTKIGYAAMITDPEFNSAEVWFFLSLTDDGWRIEKIVDKERILFSAP